MESDGEKLPSEIVHCEILPRLPRKSLVRFKCVCKSWSSVIQNLLRNRNTHLLVAVWDRGLNWQHMFSYQINQQGIIRGTRTYHQLTLPCRKWNLNYQEAQSINGLVCFTYSVRVDLINFEDHTVYIFNPSTKESIALPVALPTYNTALVKHEFGFSSLTGQYKVLQIESVDGGFVFKILILGTSSWRHMEVDLNDLPFDPFEWKFHKKSVFVNGALHWLHGSQNIIVVFDIGDERFRVMPLPKGITSLQHSSTRLVEVDGCVGLTPQLKNIVEVWTLKDYKNQVWDKDSITIPSHLTEDREYLVPLCTVHTGELLLQSRWYTLYLYNMKNKTFTTTGIDFPKWMWVHDAFILTVTSYEERQGPLSSFNDGQTPLKKIMT